MDKGLEKYRDYLLESLRLLNHGYDKAVLTLSGGALVLSLAFTTGFLNPDETIKGAKYLVFAWCLFIFSLGCVFMRIILGIKATSKAIQQVDDGTIRTQDVGGIYSMLTIGFSYLGATALIFGLGIVTYFIQLNTAL